MRNGETAPDPVSPFLSRGARDFCLVGVILNIRRIVPASCAGGSFRTAHGVRIQLLCPSRCVPVSVGGCLLQPQPIAFAPAYQALSGAADKRRPASRFSSLGAGRKARPRAPRASPWNQALRLGQGRRVHGYRRLGKCPSVHRCAVRERNRRIGKDNPLEMGTSSQAHA